MVHISSDLSCSDECPWPAEAAPTHLRQSFFTSVDQLRRPTFIVLKREKERISRGDSHRAVLVNERTFAVETKKNRSLATSCSSSKVEIQKFRTVPLMLQASESG